MLTISLPDDLQDWVESEMEAGGFRSPDDYFRHLLEEEQVRRQDHAHDTRLEALLLEGIESGGLTEATPEWWEQLKKEVHTERNSS